jgi:hypothetical protein
LERLKPLERLEQTSSEFAGLLLQSDSPKNAQMKIVTTYFGSDAESQFKGTTGQAQMNRVIENQSRQYIFIPLK